MLHSLHLRTFSDMDRSIVSMALFYFDCYLASLDVINERLIQLVGMTSLFLAVKLHSTKKISACCMSRFVRQQCASSVMLASSI